LDEDEVVFVLPGQDRPSPAPNPANPSMYLLATAIADGLPMAILLTASMSALEVKRASSELKVNVSFDPKRIQNHAVFLTIS
jgi:hypothetical protein